MTIRISSTEKFKYGTIDNIESRAIPRGAASSSLNWLTEGDHVELRRGQAYLGTSSLQSGNGKATGLKRTVNSLGIDVLFGTFGKKLKYYDRATSEWIENGSDLLGPDVVDDNGLGIEEIFLQEYVSPAGNQLWLNSPNCAGYFKVMTANPGSSLNVYDSSKNFKGDIKIDTNRTFLWGTTKDKTGVYGSYIDSQAYTTITAEAYGTGDGATKTFAHTAGAISTTRSIFGVTITDTVETFIDDYNGNLIGSLGGTGTINYLTGFMSVTFNNAPNSSQAITTTYQWEDSNTHGISDFTKSSTRLAGEGFIFRQDEGGGAIKNINVYNTVYYCMHLKKTWALNITSVDTSATNLPYRQNVGIPNERASVETGDGIYYIDVGIEGNYKVRLLTYDLSGSTQVIPIPISNNIKLDSYNFDQAASFEFGNLICFACATKDSVQTVGGVEISVNNRMLVYNKIWKSWDTLDYGVTCFDTYDGALIGGDSLSNNFAQLFSGFDDFDAASIENYWIGLLDNLDLEGLKKSKKLYLQGLIAPDQALKVSISVDNGAFVEAGYSEDDDGNHVYTIQGNGSYVDKTRAVTIGSTLLGSGMIGGESGTTQVYAYERLLDLHLDKFEFIQIRFEAVALGYVSVSTQKWWDVRFKSRKVPRKYRG